MAKKSANPVSSKQKGKSPEKPPKVIKKDVPARKKAPEPEQDEEESESSEDKEDDGVNEAGMERLMNLLGDDGLDDIARNMLQSLNGEEEDEKTEEEESDDEETSNKPKVQARADAEDESESEDHEKEGGGNENQVNGQLKEAADEGSSEDQEEEGIELDEVSSVDEDAVPRQKITINNMARIFPSFCFSCLNS